MFAFLYKLVVLALKPLPRAVVNGEKAGSLDTFIAGLVAGYYVFGRGIQSSVNQQIVVYVFGRVVLALAKLVLQQGALVSEDYRPLVRSNAWPIFAAVNWGLVMWLFRWYPGTLQPSLQSSMDYM